MGRHTVVALAGRRVEVQTCKTNAGLVQVSIIGADRQAVAVVTLTADAAAILSQALSLEGAAAERFESELLAGVAS